MNAEKREEKEFANERKVTAKLNNQTARGFF